MFGLFLFSFVRSMLRSTVLLAPYMANVLHTRINLARAKLQ